MAIYQPPPVPHINVGGAQPYAPAINAAIKPGWSVDKPTPDADVDVNMAVVLSAWQPAFDPWPYRYINAQPYGKNNLNPTVLAVRVDNPPFGRYEFVPYVFPRLLPAQLKARQLTPPSIDNPPGFVNDYLPDPVDPFFQPQRTLIAPLIPIAVAVTYVPPPNLWLAGVLGAWQPADPAPQQRRPTQISSVDNPPSFADDLADINQIVAAWQPPDPWPIQRRPSQIVSVDNPPGYRPMFDGRSAITANAWQPPDPLALQPRYQQRSSVDNPPRYSTRDQIGAVQTWQPPDPFATQPRYSVVQPGVTVVYVPFSQAWLVNVIGAWQPPDPIPLQRRPTFLAGMSVDNPPRITRAGVITGQIVSTWWQPPDPQPWQKPATIRVSVDQPRPRQMAWFTTVMQTWQPSDPQPMTSLRHLPVLVTAVPVDNPPFDMRARVNRDILQTWQPSLIAYSVFQARARFIPVVRVQIVAHPSLRGGDFEPTLIGREREFE